MLKKIGIVLVNYKDYAAKFLPACRDSLRLQDYKGEANIYIVDNASSETSKKLLEELYPEAIVIPRPDGNYSAANNLGFTQAIEDGCDYLITVNMDTEMDRSWLSELVLALDNNPEAGVAQSKILLYSENKAEKKINTLGNIIHFLGFGTTSYYRETDREIDIYQEIKGYASGCCFIVRKELFMKIGAWNEWFYMYHDDIEFSLKVRLSGSKIILAPNSVIYHKYEFSRSQKMLYFMERNRYILIFSFYPCLLILLLLPPLFIMSLGMMFYSIINGWFKIWLKVHAFFLNPLVWWKIFRFRRRIKKLSKVPAKDVFSDMSGKLEFVEIDNVILRRIVNPIMNRYWQIIKKII